MSSPANRRRPTLIPLGDADRDPQKHGAAAIAAVQELACEYLQQDGLAHFFIEKDLHILWMNGAGEALFARQSIFKEKGGRLRVYGRANQEAFKKLFAPSAGIQRTCLTCEETKRHVLVDIVSLLDGGSTVLTARIAEDLSLTVNTLSAAFGLTMTESALVQSMFQGLTAEDIAAQMGVSINTLRTHIRNIYGKLSVSSREGMMNRLLPYVIP